MQEIEPDEALNLPTGQTSQAVPDVPDWKYPDEQLEHVEDAATEKVPLTQDVQVAAALALYVPAAQAAQRLLPVPLKYPDVQPPQVEVALVALK